MRPKPPPWESGQIVYNRRERDFAYYKGPGGWVVGEGREILHCIPLVPDPDRAPHGIVYWDRADCEPWDEVKSRFTLLDGGKK